jgi:hypothetical protein
MAEIQNWRDKPISFLDKVTLAVRLFLIGTGHLV